MTVSQERAWEASPDMHTLLTVLHGLLRHSEHFMGMLLTAFMRIIALNYTVAAISGIALHQSIQATEFIQNWHWNAGLAWGSQAHIDQEINIHLVDLENTVLILGEEI